MQGTKAEHQHVRLHAHGADCGCAGRPTTGARRRASDVLASLAPALACLVCPACLTTYAKALGSVGLGVALSESQHAVFVALAVAIALVSGIRRLRETRRAGPFVATSLGCAAIVAEHVTGGSRPLAALGIVLLLVGGAWAHQLARSVRRAAAPA